MIGWNHYVINTNGLDTLLITDRIILIIDNLIKSQYDQEIPQIHTATVRQRHRTSCFTLSVFLMSLFPSDMIAKLERILSTA